MTDASRNRWLWYGAIALVAVFIAAMVAGLLQARRAEGELARTQSALRVTELEATLAAAAIEAERGSYEVSRQLLSGFFTGLQQSTNELPAEVRPALTALLGQRDATITLLSRGDPQSANVLSRMHAQYRTAVRGPDATAPMAAPSVGGAEASPPGDTAAPVSTPVPRP